MNVRATLAHPLPYFRALLEPPMHSDSQHPLQRDSQPLPGDVEAIAFAFRDACERAAWRADSLAVALRFFRSVVTLAAVLRGARADAGLPSVWDAAAIGLLEQVTIATAEYLGDPDLSDDDAARLHRIVAALGRALHAARTGGRKRRQQPMQREDDGGTREMVRSGPTVAEAAEPSPPGVQRNDRTAERGEGSGGKTPHNVSGVGAVPGPRDKPGDDDGERPMHRVARQHPLHPENRHIPAN